VDNSTVQAKIEQLVEEEQTLLRSEEGSDPDPEKHQRLELL
jgi:hypothetical protein